MLKILTFQSTCSRTICPAAKSDATKDKTYSDLSFIMVVNCKKAPVHLRTMQPFKWLIRNGLGDETHHLSKQWH